MAPSPLLPQWYESAIFYPGGSSLATSNFSIHISTHRFLFRSHKEGFHSEMKFNHTSRLPRFQPDLDLAKFFDFVFSSLPTLLFLPQASFQFLEQADSSAWRPFSLSGGSFLLPSTELLLSPVSSQLK